MQGSSRADSTWGQACLHLAEVANASNYTRKRALEFLNIFLVSFLILASIHVCIRVFQFGLEMVVLFFEFLWKWKVHTIERQARKI